MRYTILFSLLVQALLCCAQPLLKVKHYGAAEGLLSPGVNCLAQDHDGFIWIGSNMGLTRFDGIHFHTFPVKVGNEGAFAMQPRRMAVDEQNRIWIGTRRGLFVFDSNTGTFHQPDNPADGDLLQWQQPVDQEFLSQIDWGGYLGGARSMLTDSEGGRWIGSFYEGLFYVNTCGSRFCHVTFEDSHPLVVRPIVTVDDGSIFVGTENSGLFSLTDHGLTPVKTFGKANIQSLAADANRLWVATFGQGIYLYDYQSEKVVRHFHAADADSSLTQENVVCLLLTKDGDLLAGTTDGLFAYQQTKERFEPVSHTDGAFIHALAQTADGTLWAGSLNQQLMRVSKQGDGYLAEADTAFVYPCVTSLLADGDGSLWIGTDSKGVWQHRADGSCQATPLTGSQLRSSANVLIKDNGGQLWVSTFNGLFCMDNGQQTATPSSAATVSRYSQANGLPTNFFSYASACMLTDGRMLMGTHNGLVVFSPSQFQLPRTTLQPRFTNVRIGDRDTIAVNKLTLAYDAPSVTIDYAVPTYAHQPEVWYRYQVDNEQWTVVQGGDGRIYFSHLPPGEYVVSLQASMNPNTWDGLTAQLLIVVTPPWWRTWWAWLLYILLFTGVVALLWRQWRQKAERDALRQQIARLLEDQELMRSTPQMSPYSLIKDITPKNRSVDDFMERVDSYLEAHVGDPQLSVDTLATHLGMSSSTFYRRMKGNTSFTPNEYIRLYRLKKAALMLREEGLPIREVSERLCFSSVAYFTNCFSHQFGITPGEYVKS